MRVNSWLAIRAAMMGYVEILLTLPVLLMIHLFIIQGDIYWVWLFTLGIGYGVGCMLWLVWPKGKLSQCHMVSAGLALLFSMLLFGISFIGVIGFLILWLALYRGGLYAIQPEHVVLPVNFYVFSITLYFLVSIIARFNLGKLSTLIEVLGWSTVATIAVTLFMMNRYVLEQEASHSGQSRAVGRSVRWKNRLLIGIFAALTLIIASLKSLMDAFTRMYRAIGEWLWGLFTSEGNNQVNTAQPVTDIVITQPMQRYQETSPLVELLLQLGKWVALLVVLLGVLFLTVKIIDLLTKGMKRLIAWARRTFMNEVGERIEYQDYEDEVERLADWRDIRKRWSDQMRSWIGRDDADNWGKQRDNIERIRYLYRVALSYILQDGYRYDASLTPRETKRDADQWKGREALPEALVRTYEEARYGGKEPTDEQVISMKRRLMG